MGVPKTIDNDLFGTDHCPGYASAAKYIATSCMEVSKDCRVYDNGTITVIEIMGRHAGWLAGSAALATYCGSGPDLVYLPEVDFDMERFFADVHRVYEQKNSVLIAVSEGIHYADGSFVSEAKASATDGFGHAQLGGLAARLAQALKEREHAKVRGIELSLLQRAGAHLASQTDIDEAFSAGKTAVEAAIAGETGKMVALMRENIPAAWSLFRWPTSQTTRRKCRSNGSSRRATMSRRILLTMPCRSFRVCLRSPWKTVSPAMHG